MISLGELCEFRRGLTYNKSDEVVESSNVVLRANNVERDTGKLVFDELRYIRGDIEIPDSKRIHRDTLLICTASGSKNHLGKVAIIDIDEDFAFGGFMGLLVPSDRVLPRYLYWITQSDLYWNHIRRMSDGLNINNLKWKELALLKIPLPPLAEQKRIVASLDEAFEAIERAAEYLKASESQISDLFDAVLRDHFAQPHGPTPDARGDRDPGPGRRGGGGAREHQGDAVTVAWQTKQLGDLCTIRPPKKEARAKLDDSAEVGFLPMEDLGNRQQAVTTLQTKKLGDVYKGYTYFADGDVLLAKITPCFQNGKLGIARGLPNGVGFGSSEYFVLRSNGEILPEYLFYFLSRDSFTEGGVRQMSGAVGHQRVPPEYVASQEIPLPPLAEQKRIVVVLDSIGASCARGRELKAHQLDRLKALRGSILDRAFNGKMPAKLDAMSDVTGAIA